MIDLQSEGLLSLADAAKALPRINGRRIHVSTLWRWSRKGVRGVRLEHVRLGHRVCTSLEALNRFAKALADDQNVVPVPPEGRSQTSPPIDPVKEAGFTDAGNTIGIRLRRPMGRKFCITGSRAGLFIPAALDTDAQLLIAEGESDTAALLDLNFAVIGRPGCASGVGLIVNFCRRHGAHDVVVVADQGQPGQHGAARLAASLRAKCPLVRVITPPAADARAWRQQGATSAQMLQLIRNAHRR